MTYNKSLYPLVYNPPASTGVNLPPEIDWLQDETIEIANKLQKQSSGRNSSTNVDIKREVVKAIVERIRPFAIEQGGIIIAKGSAESGARNFSRFDILKHSPSSTDESGPSSTADDRVDELELQRAGQFIYEVSKGQNVTIQRAIISTPLAWMNHKAVDEFISRQIRDFSLAVDLTRYPKPPVYGTLRVILSSGQPRVEQLDDRNNWVASHPISLTSLQIATNVGR